MTALDWSDDVRASYAARGLGGRLSPRGRTAVLVVDLVNGFTDPTCPPGSDLSEVVHATRRVLGTARHHRIPVIFTTIAFEPEELDSTLWLEKMPAMRVLVAGSHWVEVDPRLDRRTDETVVVKKAASAFAGTELAAQLQAQGVATLVVCGATTSGCIRATVVDACALGLVTFVPRECVGDRAAGPHEANLVDIDAKYGDVVSTDSAVNILARGRVSA